MKKKQAEHEAILSESRQVFEGQLNILESKILYLQNNLGNNYSIIIIRKKQNILLYFSYLLLNNFFLLSV